MSAPTTEPAGPAEPVRPVEPAVSRRPREFATVTGDDVVTGEGVAIDLPPASLGLRMTSGLIDLVTTVVLLVMIVLVASIATIALDEALAAAITLVSVVAVVVGFPTALETLTRGRSLGKLALGLRTVRDDAAAITVSHALMRALVGVVEIYAFLGTPAFFSMLLNPRGKRLGDLAAGTYVVRSRVPLRLVMPPPMPPALEAWARSADITSLPTGLALAVRQYLGRLPTLDPSAREVVGRRLVEQVLPHVAPPPPRHAPPEQVLGAVIASRRERDLGRLRREAELRRRLTAGGTRR